VVQCVTSTQGTGTTIIHTTITTTSS
jgi:hypothetical protein